MIKDFNLEEAIDEYGIEEIDVDYAREIIEEREPIGLYYYDDNGEIMALDNSSGNAWVESFETTEAAIKYLIGYDEDDFNNDYVPDDTDDED